MPQQYSPIDGSELDGAIELFPRTAFLMLHDNKLASRLESDAQKITREELKKSNIDIKIASGLPRTGDYLLKIIRMIQGCGLGIAVFSEATPAYTLANIFFEVGYCLALGKPTQLILCGDADAPSDFVRSEWIRFRDTSEEDYFRKNLSKFCQTVDQYGDFILDIAITAEDAEEMDPELAYERFKRAYLYSGKQEAIDGIRRIHRKTKNLSDLNKIGRLMNSNRRNLSDGITQFLRLAQRTNDK